MIEKDLKAMGVEDWYAIVHDRKKRRDIVVTAKNLRD
jgi:hypothetical protein